MVWRQCALAANSWLDLLRVTANVGDENPKGFGFYLQVNRQLRNGRMDMFQNSQLSSGRLTFQLPIVDAPYLGGSATSTQLPG
jgi:hypothetical protein